MPDKNIIHVNDGTVRVIPNKPNPLLIVRRKQCALTSTLPKTVTLP